MHASPAQLLPVERKLRKSDFKSRGVLMYAFKPSDYTGNEMWFEYIKGDLYVNVYNVGKTCFTENDNPDPVLTLDGGYVQKQFKQDHEVEARSASPVPDEPEAFSRAPSAPVSEDAREDSESDWGLHPPPGYGLGPDDAATVARNVLDNIVVEVEKNSAAAVFGTQARRLLAMEASARETKADSLLQGVAKRYLEKGKKAALVLQEQVEENKRQQEAADLAEKNLLEQQRAEQEQLLKKQQEQDTELKERQDTEKETRRQQQVDLENEQATQKKSDEEKQRETELAREREALEERQRNLDVLEQQLEQRIKKQDLDQKQQEELLKQQQKAIEDSRERMQEQQKTQKELQDQKATDDARLQQQQQTVLDTQRDEQALEKAELATQLAAMEGASGRRRAAQNRRQDALNRLRARQRRTAHALATRLTSLEKLENETLKRLRDISSDVLGSMEAVEAQQQRTHILLEQRELSQKLQAHTFATQLTSLEAIEKQLDDQAAQLLLQRSQPMGPTANGAGAGARVGAAAGGDTTDADATIADLQRGLAVQRRVSAALRHQMYDEKQIANLRLTEKDKEADGLYDRLGGRPPPEAPPVDPTEEFEFKDYHGGLDYGDWIAAMDSLCLFRDTDKSYVLFHTDWQTVLHENGLLLAKIAARAVPFRTWELSRVFFEANKGSCRLIPFWSNLYYQFGLITQRLTKENLRPWGAGQRERLIGWCRTVCTAAQGQLYKDEADYLARGAVDRRRYRKMYNSCHGCLRWFWHADNDLHVDIRFLDKIMSAYFTEYTVMEYERLPLSHIREAHILHSVFTIENWDETDAEDVAWTLDREVERAEKYFVEFDTETLRVSRPCRAALETISKWKWRVLNNAHAGDVYARIYEHARQGEDGEVSAAAMLWVQAVEHHRRYTLHEGPTGEC